MARRCAQRRELRGQRARLAPLLAVAGAGGLLGAVLLLRTGTRSFAGAVPWLILLACALLALQERLRAALTTRNLAGAAGETAGSRRTTPYWLLPLIGAGAVYGGYFGAGMSVVMLAALAVAYADALPRLNALKQLLALAANLGRGPVSCARRAGRLGSGRSARCERRVRRRLGRAGGGTHVAAGAAPRRRPAGDCGGPGLPVARALTVAAAWRPRGYHGR